MRKYTVCKVSCKFLHMDPDPNPATPINADRFRNPAFNIVRYESKLSDQNVGDSCCTVWLKVMDCAEDALILIITFLHTTGTYFCGSCRNTLSLWTWLKTQTTRTRGWAFKKFPPITRGQSLVSSLLFLLLDETQSKMFRKGLLILTSTYFLCMRWWFSRSIKSFSLPYPIQFLKLFICSFQITY